MSPWSWAALAVGFWGGCASSPPAPEAAPEVAPLSDEEACVRAGHHTTVAFLLQEGKTRDAAEAVFAAGLADLKELCARPIAHEPDQQKQYRCLAAAETPEAIQACLDVL